MGRIELGLNKPNEEPDLSKIPQPGEIFQAHLQEGPAEPLPDDIREKTPGAVLGINNADRLRQDLQIPTQESTLGLKEISAGKMETAVQNAEALPNRLEGIYGGILNIQSEGRASALQTRQSIFSKFGGLMKRFGKGAAVLAEKGIIGLANTAEAVGKGIVSGAEAVGRGVTKGVEVAASGVEAAGRGAITGAEAIGRGVAGAARGAMELGDNAFGSSVTSIKFESGELGAYEGTVERTRSGMAGLENRTKEAENKLGARLNASKAKTESRIDQGWEKMQAGEKIAEAQDEIIDANALKREAERRIEAATKKLQEARDAFYNRSRSAGEKAA